jgi:deoxyribonuclease V
MLAALDVQYDDEKSQAVGAAILFRDWEDAVPVSEYTAVFKGVAPYAPGEFFRRELPCLAAVFAKIQEPVEILVIDGYVQLDERPGLGAHLYQHLGGNISVIGVPKSRFHSAKAVEVLRGKSRSPLLVTSIGINLNQAAAYIRKMHGSHRTPTLLKRVDQLARGR